MDEKTKIACACSQLNEAIHALEQSTFSLKYEETIRYRDEVWRMHDDLKKMVDELIKIQARIRREFNEILEGEKK